MTTTASGLLCWRDFHPQEWQLASLHRTSAESSLRTWGLKLKERIGFKRAAVAVARKLAVVMHAMLRSGQLFDRTAGMAA
jgi:transposase